MQKITLYRYEREGGGITVSAVEPSTEYTITYRLIADEGKTLTDGEAVTPCIDTDYPEQWTEIDDPDYKPEQEDGPNE